MKKLALNSCLRIFLCQFKWWFYYVCSIKMSGCHPYCLNSCFLASVAKVIANVPRENTNLYKPEQRQHFGFRSHNNLKDHIKNVIYMFFQTAISFNLSHDTMKLELSSRYWYSVSAISMPATIALRYHGQVCVWVYSLHCTTTLWACTMKQDLWLTSGFTSYQGTSPWELKLHT